VLSSEKLITVSILERRCSNCTDSLVANYLSNVSADNTVHCAGA